MFNDEKINFKEIINKPILKAGKKKVKYTISNNQKKILIDYVDKALVI